MLCNKVMNYIEKAVESPLSTILYGSLGRYPYLLQFYLEALPYLEYASEYELVFWYRKRRLLYVLLEPPFDIVLPSNRWFLVLTSHPRIHYDSLTTRFICCDHPLEKDIPFPQIPKLHEKIIVPPTSHIEMFFEGTPAHIDLSETYNSHEAYLRLLTWYDVVLPFTAWSLSIPEKLRRNLLKDLPNTGVYDTHLRKMLQS